MSDKTVRAKLFGEVELSCGEVRISEGRSRSRQTWLLLAYLLVNRDHTVQQAELVRLIGADTSVDNPAGTLKTAIWRMRKAVKPISDALGADLVQSDGGGYKVNPEAHVEVDIEQFEKLLAQAANAQDDDARLALLESALELSGSQRFLEGITGYDWADYNATYFQTRYLEGALVALPLMITAGKAVEAERTARELVVGEPYDESLHQLLMRSLVAQGRLDDAADEYNQFCTKLFSELGVMASDEMQEIYRDIISRSVTQPLAAADIVRGLREQDAVRGALVCDYARFKLFYQAEARSAMRRGDAIHLALLTVAAKPNRVISERVLRNAMDQLLGVVAGGLRMGDVVTQCSASQLVVMLLQANYENSSMVCGRLVERFALQHPKSPVKVTVSILPLEPTPLGPGDAPEPVPAASHTWGN